MTKKILTQSRLKELLHYNANTGVLTWVGKASPKSHVEIGSEAGCIHLKNSGKKYLRVGIDGIRHIFAHHLAWLYVYGEFPPNQIDHINGNGLDNCLINLRAATQTENNKNARKSTKNTSGVTGVGWAKRAKKWCAQIKHKGKSFNLGYFNNFNDAVIIRKMAEYELGFHPNHGSERPL